MAYALAEMFPRLADRLPRLDLGVWPTPLHAKDVVIDGNQRAIAIKCDDQSNPTYGGNKVRKLEYLLQRARLKNAKRIATFGTVASNHALATALHARAQNLECTCFLSHQHRTAKAAVALNTHLANGTEIVRFGGSRAARIETLRQHLRGRDSWVIPMGGSNWLGAVGFIDAGLELVTQYESIDMPLPDRIYIANGTMASAAGLALGLALMNAPTHVHAVRVTHDFIANDTALQRLLRKTANMLRRYDDAVPNDLANRAAVTLRDGYLGDGYAHSNAATDRAIAWARDQLSIDLEATYTGKAMAAMLDDLVDPEYADQSFLFWNTYSSARPITKVDQPANSDRLPPEFLRYYESSR